MGKIVQLFPKKQQPRNWFWLLPTVFILIATVVITLDVIAQVLVYGMLLMLGISMIVCLISGFLYCKERYTRI